MKTTLAVSKFLEFWISGQKNVLEFRSSRGVAKLVKAPDFDSGMRGFESFLPCQNSYEYDLRKSDSGKPAASFA